MSFFPDGANVKVGSGALFLDSNDPDTGLPTGLQSMGNATAIGLTASETRIELLSSMDKSRGVGRRVRIDQASATGATASFGNVVLGQYYELGALDVTSVVGLAGAAANGSSAFVGNVGNGTMGTITRTSPKAGVFTIVMTSAGPTAAFSVTDPDGVVLTAGAVGTAYSQGGLAFTISDGSTDFAIGDTFTITQSSALALGVDYDLDPEVGFIHLRPTSALVADGSNVFFTFNKPAQNREKIQAGALSSQIARLVYIADDANASSVGHRDILEAWKVEVAPTGDLGLISTDYGSFPLSMTVLSDAVNHPTEPYYTLTRKVV